jgi:hypothetical protein
LAFRNNNIQSLTQDFQSQILNPVSSATSARRLKIIDKEFSGFADTFTNSVDADAGSTGGQVQAVITSTANTLADDLYGTLGPASAATIRSEITGSPGPGTPVDFPTSPGQPAQGSLLSSLDRLFTAQIVSGNKISSADPVLSTVITLYASTLASSL